MKKKIIMGTLALAFAVASAYGIKRSMDSNADLSDLALANVEALAQGESSGNLGTLYGDASGKRYCCSSGSSQCGAASCPW